MKPFDFASIWRWFSEELMDTGMQVARIRRYALREGDKQLYHNMMVRNEDDRPSKVQWWRYLALRNLLHSVERALADGRISSMVRRALIKNFVSQVVITDRDRIQTFPDLHGYEPPAFLTISPTKKCNLRCVGCYAASSASHVETLDYAVLQRVMDEKTNEWGSHFTVLSGGEPLLYRSEGRDFFDLLRDYQDNYFMMYTNGTLITRQVAEKMAYLGNISPAISVEGWQEQTDARRGRGVFDRIMKAMEHLRAVGVPFGISMTATRENAELLLSEKLMNFYFEQQGAVYGWIFQYMPIGRSFTVDLMITPEQRLWMLEQEMRMIEQNRLFLVDFWNGGPMSMGCIAAGRPGGYFYIDWNGNIAPCAFFPYYLDNVYRVYRRGQKLIDAMESEYFSAIRNWQDEYAYRCLPERMGNLFMPCSIRDHYDFAHKTIQRFHAKPLDEDAAKALQDQEYRQRMLDYDRRISELLDPIWERENFAAGNFQEMRGQPGA